MVNQEDGRYGKRILNKEGGYEMIEYEEG